MLLFARSRKPTVGIKGREIQINWLRKLKRKPEISVVVVVYNMGREAPRTLRSLSANYQRHIEPDDYEVIVVDNGSSPPLDPKVVTALDGNFRLIRIDHALPSPAQAINKGLAVARGAVIGVMIDGARIVTPGLLHFARHGASLYDRAVVATLGWYLGHDFQCAALMAGYNQAREDALLDSIDWPSDGYRLFDIGTLDESSIDGWLQPITESNALFLRRESWELLGGLDERFDAPGGGLLNLDTFGRALELPDAELVILLGEGTFHQLHGGVSTNSPPENQHDNWSRWSSQYTDIRGRPYEILAPRQPPTYIGTLTPAALARVVHAAIHPSLRSTAFEPPLGIGFDKSLWTSKHFARSKDETIAALIDLADNEFLQGRFEACCAVARLIRQHAPDEHEPQRLLSLVAAFHLRDGLPADRIAAYHCALGEAHRLLGDRSAAASEYQKALTFDPDLKLVHDGLAMLGMALDE